MPGNDREVFLHLKSDESTPEAEDLLTFAMFAYEKDEWIKHFTETHGAEPAQAEIDNWTANITDYHFARLRQEAAAFFDTAAREYLKSEIAAAEERALETAIVSQVKAAGSWPRQFGIAVVTAVLTPIILGLAVAGILASNRYMPAVIQLPALEQPSSSEPQK